MLYILALLLPPVAIMLTGRVILGMVVLVIWFPAILISGGLGHPIFILLAWLIIHQSAVKRG
ncbi:MAG: hypothetical protein ACU0E9_13560 [Limimaricola soesokkakensis]|jgi:hypothetical protein|uniref:Proteolipid membrane potential modulator n=2 Tax=Limimaricola TaxID=2211638 RepID=A0A1X6ZG78_9RHOB|nr:MULTISPECIES: hypothetical protein [Limimaricola]MBB3710845.1 hypothetical protein [Limimaricola variabilis]MCZ4260208.1 hypothetical protein [Limimaricola sp. G21655-S1]PSK86070.1 hypothetical protein CLV79_10677 [Limimaricola soesokkakensis]WPY95401.1 hypothetical protein T8T21_04535 [Limimaricola variabilis]SLN50810.1 hypothetical protein LOS8367_02303 [Limimaricola soesokkakensis]